VSPLYAASIIALLSFLIACAKLQRAIGRGTGLSSAYVSPSRSQGTEPVPSGRPSRPAEERVGQVRARRSAKSANCAFLVVRLRGELALIPESGIQPKVDSRTNLLRALRDKGHRGILFVDSTAG